MKKKKRRVSKRKLKKLKQAEKRKRRIRRTKWILNIPSDPKEQRGLEAEQKVLKALKYLKKKKTKFPGERMIKDFRQTMHFSSDDRSAKDFIVEFQKNGRIEELPVQVQNWWKKEVEDRYIKRGICLVAVWPTEKDAKARTFNAINKFWKMKDEELSRREQESKTTQGFIRRFVYKIIRIIVKSSKFQRR